MLLAVRPAMAFNPDANAAVYSVAIQNDGRLLIGGDFTTVGGVARGGFARLEPDGTVDQGFHNSAPGGSVRAVAVQPDGKLLIGGRGAGAAGGLARIHADGSVDEGFTDAFTGGSATIRSIVPLANGKILIGGTFSEIGGQARTNIARLNADGTLDTGFDAGTAAEGTVYAIATEAGGTIVVGGMNLLARLDADGTPAGAPLPAVSGTTVTALTVQADGKILIGAANGALYLGDAVNRGQLARLNPDGSVDEAFAPGIVEQITSPIALQPDGRIVLAYGYSGKVVRLQADGSADSSFAGPSTSQLNALALQSDGKIVIAGSFYYITGLNRGQIARLHPDGRLDNGAAGPLTVNAYAVNGSISPSGTLAVGEGSRLTFELTANPGYALAAVTGCDGTRLGTTYTTGWLWADCNVVATFIDESQASFDADADNFVEQIALQADGRIVAGGWFTRIGGIARRYAARLSPVSGAAEPDYAEFPNGTVYGLALQADGKALFGIQYGGVHRVNVDGTLDSGFAAGVDDGTIYAIAEQPDGKILIGGYFSQVGGVPRNNIARLNADGSLDATFDPGSGADHYVYDIAPAADGRVVIVGAFTGFDGQNHHGMARLNSDGSLDATFPATRTDTYVARSLADGSVLVGAYGAINLADGSPADSSLVKILPSGARDLTFEARVNGSVESLAVQPDGAVVAVGDLNTVNGTSRGRIARLSPAGALDESFEASADSTIKTVALQADGKILIGGRFGQVNGYARRYIARLKTDGRIDIDGFQVTPYASDHGTITPNVPQTVLPGETAQFTIVPDPGYIIGTVSGCNGSLDGLVYTTGPITGHCAVNADFLMETVTHTVTPLAAGPGSLSPDSPQQVLYAQSFTFDVLPDAGHYLAAIEGCNGSLSEDRNRYTTERILADCSVTATFSTPASIAAAAGTPQITAVNTRFAQPLSVRVTDAAGNPVPGVEIGFEVPDSEASALLSAASATTDAEGMAQVQARANAAAGAYQVVARAGAHSVAFALTNEAIDHGGLELRVTMDRRPAPSCGTESQLRAVVGDHVNYCFTVTNHSDVVLRYHTLTVATFGSQYQFSVFGTDRLFDRLEHPLAPGESFQYNHIVAVGDEPQVPHFTWTSTAAAADYELDAAADVPFTDISGGTPLAVNSVTAYDVAELPFPITFYGQTFLDGGIGRMCVSNSGTLSLMRGAGDEICEQPGLFYLPPLLGDNQQLIYASLETLNRNAVLAYWDRLGDNGAVYMETLGTAPNRRLIVQWQDKDRLAAPNPANGITFQAVVEEQTGRVHFVYRSLSFDTAEFPSPDYGGSATTGVIGYTGGSGRAPYIEHSYNAPALADGQAITLTPTDVPRYASAAVRIDVGRPSLSLDRNAIEAAVPVGSGRVTEVLRVGNAGDMELAWSLKESAGRRHFPDPAARRLEPSIEQREAANPHPATEPPVRGDENGTTGWFDPSLFEVPAYGVLAVPNRGYPISFDANEPLNLSHIPASSGGGQLLGGDFVGNDFSRLYVFDTLFDWAYSFSAYDVTTGVFTNIAAGEAVAPDNSQTWMVWSGAAWDPTTETFYATTTADTYCDGGNLSDLYRIDVASGTPTRIGPIDLDGGAPVCIADIAVAPDGAMYGIDSHGKSLVAIDKDTGQAATIGWLGFNLGGGLGFPHSTDFDDVTGLLYLGAAQSALQPGGVFKVNTSTGLASWVGAVQPPTEVSWWALVSLGIARSGGPCVDPETVPWISANQIAGVVTPNAQVPIETYLDATGLEEGVYEANLCFFSNDRSRSLVRVPVRLDVGGAPSDRIFADGFEGTP